MVTILQLWVPSCSGGMHADTHIFLQGLELLLKVLLLLSFVAKPILSPWLLMLEVKPFKASDTLKRKEFVSEKYGERDHGHKVDEGLCRGLQKMILILTPSISLFKFSKRGKKLMTAHHAQAPSSPEKSSLSKNTLSAISLSLNLCILCTYPHSIAARWGYLFLMEF